MGSFFPSPFSQGCECHTFFTALYMLQGASAITQQLQPGQFSQHFPFRSFPNPRARFLQSLHPTAPDLQRRSIFTRRKNRPYFFYLCNKIKICFPRETCYRYKIDKRGHTRHRQTGKGSNTKKQNNNTYKTGLRNN